ncbi:hypothetical protein K2173_004268 [Erythroxylum novogranatense]|uniref:GATA-type domain-containing protein n=1 Tax=Erythroxylum novogranatense TaxID=1862640 RepID=A0AAV8U572_9ROSI|nr:hypothetical protein K2173_004268 [Erythroxylum novogranatense]
MEVPGFFVGGYYGPGAGDYMPGKRVHDHKNGEHFRVDDLLDFPSEEDVVMSDGFLDNVSKNSINGNDSSTFTSNDSCNSSGSAAGNVRYQSFGDSQFSSELCVPYDDLAELEWLSNFVDDSFSTDQTLQSNHHILSPTPEDSSSETHPCNQIFHSETPLPAKARSKRSRVAPGDWSTRLLHLSPIAKTSSGKQENPNSEMHSGSDTPVRKCLHCAAEKTPQWRTGPMGPKTLCNAFLELRRQREMQDRFPSETSHFDVSNGGDDFLTHHHSGPNFRQSG